MEITVIDLTDLNATLNSYVSKEGLLRFNRVGREKAATRYADVINKIESHPAVCELREKFTDFDRRFTSSISLEEIKKFHYEVIYSTGYIQFQVPYPFIRFDLGMFYRRQIDAKVLFYVLSYLNNHLPDSNGNYASVHSKLFPGYHERWSHYAPFETGVISSYDFIPRYIRPAVEDAYMFLKGYRPSKYDKEEYDRYDPFLKMFDDYKQQVKGLATAIGVDTRTEAEKRADKWRERKTKIADILAEVALVFIIFLIGLLLSKCNG